MSAKMFPEEVRGYGVRVGGAKPYIAYCFATQRDPMEKFKFLPYHKVIRVVMISRTEYDWMKKQLRKFNVIVP